MEYRIKDYTIRAQMILLPRPTTIEDLRLIFNETQKKLICSTANKDLVTLRQQDGGTVVVVPSSVCTLNETDQLTIKCDYGDNLSSVESKVETEADSIEAKIDESVNTLSTKIDNIDLSAVESKVQEESAAIQEKIDNIKLTEIDTTELAKQGENQEATMSAVYNSINEIKGDVIDVVKLQLEEVNNLLDI